LKRSRGFLKKIIVFLLVVMIIMTAFPCSFTEIFAASGPIGSVNGTYYYSLSSLNRAIYNNVSHDNITVEMLMDWDVNEDDDFDEPLIIDRNQSVTFNMNGHIFNRARTRDNDWTSSGLLIYVRDEATLTINGGDTSIAHDTYIHSSTDEDEYANTYYKSHGGTLTGGSSTNSAGGIHIKNYAKVTLNDVTIAGCRAEQYFGSDGYGGGICLDGAGSTLKLNNSTIIGCYAYNYGGGIYQSDYNQVGIEMKNSKIDRNYAGSGGAGISFSGEKCYIMGDDTSTVNSNVAGKIGGGIYIWNDDVSVSKLTVNYNKVESSSGDGGGIYVQETGVKLCNLAINYNAAGTGGSGDGVYINNEKNTISSCSITNNYGHGVYVVKNVDEDFKIEGCTVIKDNTGYNLYLADSNAKDTRILFNLTKGSEVHVYYRDSSQQGEDQIYVTPGETGDSIRSSDCTKYLYSDNDGYYFGFLSAPNERKIVRIRGTKPEIPEATAVSADKANDASGKIGDYETKAGVVDTVGPGGGTDTSGGEYDLVRGFYTHESIEGDGDNNVVFYYSDGFFDGDPKDYNEHLATLSLNMVSAAMYLIKAEDSIDGNIYYNRHAGGRQFLADIGVPDQNIYVNDSNVSKPQTDSIGVIIGSKELEYSDGTKTGKILIPVAVRGGGYELEWASNMTLGDSSYNLSVRGKELEHKGFSGAADQVCAEIDYYISKYDLQDEIESGNVCFWVVGFSRAGATANITAKRLVEKYAHEYNDKVFAYPCEAPQGGSDAAQLYDGDEYYCIHNLINNVDVVPMVGPTLMGFKRYGVDHYLPGTDAGTVTKTEKYVRRGDSSGKLVKVTTYADNTALATKPDWEGLPDPYAAKKSTMLEQLAMVDSDIVFDDYFHPMALDFVPNVKMYENGQYYGNKAEDFVADFVRFLQEGTESYIISDPSQAVPNRDMYVSDLQTAFREMISLVFTLPNDEISVMMGRASLITERMSLWEMVSFYDDCIGDWSTLDTSKKQYYKDYLWKQLQATDALDALKPADQEVIAKNWDVLCEFLFRLIEGDYNYYPGSNTETSQWAKAMDENMTMLATFVEFSSYILSCHYPEVSIAWARSYDSYYCNYEHYEYKITAPTSVAAPGAYVTNEGTETTLSTAAVNNLNGDQKIILENKNIVGEACYYDLYDGDTKLASNQIYRGGIDLTLDGESEKTYTIETYDISYSTKSAKATYVIKLTDDKHQVTVKDLNSSGQERSDVKIYSEGQRVSILAGNCAAKYFKNWKIEMFAPGETTGVDVTDSLPNVTDKTISGVLFDLPETSSSYPAGYSLVATAEYGDRITEITDAGVLEQIPTGTLPSTATFTFGNGETEWYPISWSYVGSSDSSGERIVPTNSGETVFKDTVYIASVKLSQSQADNIMFADKVAVNNLIDSAVGQITNLTDAKLIRNNTDGSLTMVIRYEKTSSSESGDRPGTNITLKVIPFDLNIREPIWPEEDWIVYGVSEGNTYTITAPTIEDEVFVGWDIRSPLLVDDATKETIHLTLQNVGYTGYTVWPQYMPVVSEIKAVVGKNTGSSVTAQSPQTGKIMPSDVELTVKITNEYKVDPDYIELTWSPDIPADGKAESLVTYTLTIGLKPDSSGKIRITRGNIEYFITPQFVYSDSLIASVNGNDAICNLSTNDPQLTFTFPQTKYVLSMIKEPSDISDIANGTDLTSVLPETVKVLTENGIELDCAVSWDTPEQISGEGDSRNAAVYRASGTVVLPDYVELPVGKSLDVEMYIEVNSADTASKPEASLETGTYFSAQTTTLSSLEDGSIYYTTDGSDPADAGNTSRMLYDGNEIKVSGKGRKADEQGQKFFTLRAVAVKDGMWDSDEAVYSYTLITGPDDEDSYTLIFDLNGGSLDGKTGVIAMKYTEGTVINLPGAPTKEGYVFDYWQGSHYEAGAEYTVEGDHTFTAIYKEAGAADDDNPSDEGDRGVDTGDHSHIRGWLSTCVISIFVLSTCIIIRRRDEIKLNHGEKDDF